LNLKIEKLTWPLKADRHIKLEAWIEKIGRGMGRKHYLPLVKDRLEDYRSPLDPPLAIQRLIC